MKRTVLFLCTANACRSQLAEGLANGFFGDRLTAVSAGTKPGAVHPLALAALAELGLDYRGARSKSIDEFLGREFDYLITLCGNADQACPAFPGQGVRLHWPIPDPAAATGAPEEMMPAFRSARDEIRRRLAELVRKMSPSPSGEGGPPGR